MMFIVMKLYFMIVFLRIIILSHVAAFTPFDVYLFMYADFIVQCVFYLFATLTVSPPM